MNNQGPDVGFGVVNPSPVEIDVRRIIIFFFLVVNRYVRQPSFDNIEMY